jgi:hypothetical protein
MIILEDEELTTIKADKGKLMLNLIPPSLYEAVGAVLTYGARKYKPYGWQEATGGDEQGYIAAMLRHIVACLRDMDSIDNESGLPHLWHVAANVAILLDLIDRRKSK